MLSSKGMYRAFAFAGAFMVLAVGAQASTISLFPTGTTVDLTLTIDTATSTITGADVRGLAGFVVTNPPISNGVLIGDFGFFPPLSNQLLGEDAATLSQFLLFTLDINAFTIGGPGIEIPVSVTDVTSPITDPALLEFRQPLLFGFAVVASNNNNNVAVDGTQTVLLNLATVDQLSVPEPGTLATMSCGLGLLFVCLRRRVRGVQA